LLLVVDAAALASFLPCRTSSAVRQVINQKLILEMKLNEVVDRWAHATAYHVQNWQQQQQQMMQQQQQQQQSEVSVVCLSLVIPLPAAPSSTGGLYGPT
jgi:hypothetical protein